MVVRYWFVNLTYRVQRGIPRKFRIRVVLAAAAKRLAYRPALLCLVAFVEPY